MSKKKDGVFRIKIEYEEMPITDVKVRGLKGFDNVIKDIKRKIL